MQKITPHLWFDDKAEEAAKFYVSVFKNSKIGTIARYPKSAESVSGRPAGSVMTASFQLDGQDFMALNGGPQFKFSEAVSFVVDCQDQAEVDYFWEKLSEGGKEGPCGWLTDKFGLSWQIVPAGMGKMMKEGSPEQQNRVMAEVLKMKKLDVNKLQQAYDQK